MLIICSGAAAPLENLSLRSQALHLGHDLLLNSCHGPIELEYDALPYSLFAFFLTLAGSVADPDWLLCFMRL
jgi:hypothetical protein